MRPLFPYWQNSFGHVRSSNKFELSFNPVVGGNFKTQLKPIYIHSVVLVSYLAKLTRVKRVVSKSCATIKGPSTRINGILQRKYNNKKLCIKQAADIVRQMNAIGQCTLLHYGQRGVWKLEGLRMKFLCENIYLFRKNKVIIKSHLE